MKIRVVAFATAADALGAPEVELEVPAGTRVAALRKHLEEEHPDLAPLWPRIAIAVGGEIASPETALGEGLEVALLPPVSGGRPEVADRPATGSSPRAGGPAEPRGRAALTDGAIDVERVTATVAGPTRGAVLVFLGTVRDSHQGRRVERLTYSAYRPMAEERLGRIVADLEAASEDLRAAIVHRLGEVPVGEASVVIACASPHRAAAYEASRTALERLKREVPIWKREHYADGDAAWREEEPLAKDPAQ